MRRAGFPRQEGEDLENGRDWTGNALDLRGNLDPYGIREIAIEFEEGDVDTFTPKLREEFQAYELQQMAGYLDGILGEIAKG